MRFALLLAVFLSFASGAFAQDGFGDFEPPTAPPQDLAPRDLAQFEAAHAALLEEHGVAAMVRMDYNARCGVLNEPGLDCNAYWAAVNTRIRRYRLDRAEYEHQLERVSGETRSGLWREL